MAARFRTTTRRHPPRREGSPGVARGADGSGAGARTGSSSSSSHRARAVAVARAFRIATSALALLFLLSMFVLVSRLPDAAVRDDRRRYGGVFRGTSLAGGGGGGDDGNRGEGAGGVRRGSTGRGNVRSGAWDSKEMKKTDGEVEGDIRGDGAAGDRDLDRPPPSPPRPPPPPRIVHVLETRYMQNQPGLAALARARLRLFEAVCLPTVVGQSAWGTFVWMIRVDPDLGAEAMNGLIEALERGGALAPRTRRAIAAAAADDDAEATTTTTAAARTMTYVIGSNDNYVVSNSTATPPGFRPLDARQMFGNALSNPRGIFTGNAESLKILAEELLGDGDGFGSDGGYGNGKEAQRAREEPLVLWTRLDADDGLNLEYMEHVQERAAEYFFPGRHLGGGEDDDEEEEEEESVEVEEEDEEKNVEIEEEDEEPGVEGRMIAKEGERGGTLPPPIPRWMYWCAGRNIDWFASTPHSPLSSNPRGVVMPVQHKRMCVTPGVTVGIAGGTVPGEVLRLDHDRIVSHLTNGGSGLCGFPSEEEKQEKEDDGGDEKKETDDSGRNDAKADNDEKKKKEHKNSKKRSCIELVESFVFSAIRSRTATSAGMRGVVPDDSQQGIVAYRPGLTDLMWRSVSQSFGIPDQSLVDVVRYFAEHAYDAAEENALGQCTSGHSCKLSSKDLLQRYVDLRTEMIGEINDRAA